MRSAFILGTRFRCRVGLTAAVTDAPKRGRWALRTVHGPSVAHDAFAGIGLRDYGSALSQPQNKPRKTLSVDRISYDQSPMGSILTSILVYYLLIFADAVIFIATYCFG
jgi:hypothetical protein